MDGDIIYFELNNWMCGDDFPNAEPFLTWCGNDFNLLLNNDTFVKENGLCVYRAIVDMSNNWCVTAKREWVENTCPELLTQYRAFLRVPDEDGAVFGRFGHPFVEWTEENIGIHYDPESFDICDGGGDE